METIIYNIIVPVVMGFIGYFLKRTMNDIDTVKQSFVSREDYDKELESVKSDIKAIEQHYATREDFFREMGKIDRKLDTINGILMSWSKKE